MTSVALHSSFYPLLSKKWVHGFLGSISTKPGVSEHYRVHGGVQCTPPPSGIGSKHPFSRPNDSTVLREKRARVFTQDGVVFGVRQAENAT